MDEARAAFGTQEPQQRGSQERLVPLGLALVVIGAIAVLVGDFLPLVHSPDPQVDIHDNAPFWLAGGEYFAFGAVTGPALAFSRWLRGDVPWWAIVLLGATGLLAVVLVAAEVHGWTLDELAWSGPAAADSDTLELGAGLLTIGAGALVATIGGLLLFTVPPPRWRSQAAATLPAEGWYHDPDDHEQLRWWDGHRWGEGRRPLPPPLERWARPQAPGVAEAAGAGEPPAALWRRPENDPPSDG